MATEELVVLQTVIGDQIAEMVTDKTGPDLNIHPPHMTTHTHCKTWTYRPIEAPMLTTIEVGA